MRVQFLLTNPGHKESGIAAQVYNKDFEGGRFFYGTGKVIAVNKWNKNQKFPKDLVEPQIQKLRKQLLEISEAIEDVHKTFNKEGRVIVNKEFKARLKQHLGLLRANKESEALSLIGFIEAMLNENPKFTRKLPQGTVSKQRTSHTIKNQRQMLRHLKDFQVWQAPASAPIKPEFIDFSTMDEKFYQSFIWYLENVEDKKIPKTKLSANSRGKIIKDLKTYLNMALDRGRPVNPKFKKFVVEQQARKALYYDFEQLQVIANIDLSDKPRLERVRDLFLLQSFTGLRYSDVIRIRENHIHRKEGYISLAQAKTLGSVRIPLNEVSLKILEKYGWKCPGWENSNGYWTTISNQKCNTFLREIEDTTPEEIWPQKDRQRKFDGKIYTVPLRSHTGRRSFASNFYKAGMDEHFLMRVTGHRTVKSFYTYIGEDEHKDFENISDAMSQAMEKVPEIKVYDSPLKVVKSAS